MKKLLFFFTSIMTFCFLDANYDKGRIEKLLQPYEQAIEFIQTNQFETGVKDYDIFIFFNKNDLYEKKDIRKFHRVLHSIKKLTYSKKSLVTHRLELEQLIETLEKIKKFIVDYAPTYYALMTCQEIAASYYYIDEHNQFIVSLITDQSEKLGLPSMEGRGLYQFVKKIERDLRRLTALFDRNHMTDQVAVQINQLKTKLQILHYKITLHAEYIAQMSKTRWLKAFGICVVPLLAIVPVACIVPSWTIVTLVGVYIVGSLIVTVKEMKESTKYNIPVHSRSIFSWFAPVFLPLTWIPRG